MFRVRFTSPVVDSSHGLARAKPRKTHKGNQICMTSLACGENDLSCCRRQRRSWTSGLRPEGPIHRAAGYAQGRCDLSHRLIGMLHQMPRLAQLSRRQGRGPAALPASRTSRSQTSHCTFPSQIAFHLRKGRHHVEEEPSSRVRNSMPSWFSLATNSTSLRTVRPSNSQRAFVRSALGRETSACGLKSSIGSLP